MVKKPSQREDDVLVLREAVKYLVGVSEVLVASALAHEPLDADALERIRRRVLFWKTATQTGGVVPVPLPPNVM
jgi:hypothetical protein